MHNKLAKQDEQLLKEVNKNSPLFIQRKQLQKDLHDFHILNKCQDAYEIQQIIDRVEHMEMFNRKCDKNEFRSIVQSNTQSQVRIEPNIKATSVSCSYRVSFAF